MSSNRFHVKKNELKDLIAEFENIQIPDYQLDGFVLSPGVNDIGEDSFFLFPLYCSIPEKLLGDDIIIENKTKARGCPYPPGYPR